MELMEIIKSSVSLFTIFLFSLVILSYVIFKIKDRSRIKPYMRVNLQENSTDNDVTITSKSKSVSEEKRHLDHLRQIQIKKDEQVAINTPQESVKNIESDNQQKAKEKHLVRQQQLRLEQLRQEQLKLDQIKMEQHRREKAITQEKIIKQAIARNSNNKFMVVNEPTAFQTAVPAIQFSTISGNIYDLYSHNEHEKMHKLKFAGNFK